MTTGNGRGARGKPRSAPRSALARFAGGTGPSGPLVCAAALAAAQISAAMMTIRLTRNLLRPSAGSAVQAPGKRKEFALPVCRFNLRRSRPVRPARSKARRLREEIVMLGLMQDWPLLCHRIIDHAAINHGERPVISRSIEGPIHTTNYSRSSRPRAAGRAAARTRRDAQRRPRGDAGLEHLAPPRGLVRHHGHRRRLSHRQSAPVPRPDRLDRQSRRGSRDDGRPHLPADPGETRRQAQADRTLRGADRRRASAGDGAEQRRGLRGVDRGGRRRFSLESLRREHRRRHVLHLRHHRQSQGRASIRTAPTCCTR